MTNEADLCQCGEPSASAEHGWDGHQFHSRDTAPDRSDPAGEVVTDDLPNGWRLHVRPGPLGIGYRVDGCYDLHRASRDIRDEAAALGVTSDYDPVITQSWAITKNRAVRFARVIVAETAAMPMGEWL